MDTVPGGASPINWVLGMQKLSLFMCLAKGVAESVEYGRVSSGWVVYWFKSGWVSSTEVVPSLTQRTPRLKHALK